ncbi:hypothetical protein TPL01_19220 [Sulfuriferula plumbiphila]|uniref:Globin n=1 Tax=Sulfuriferula plumbiphila TaxID=171865 RepID=A0A512L8H1_9PROT|nr:group III truncated hemoglobin [Sulfuriferula plumbiphila]GEP30784.1 hypothetical protein TPL01_19220 [Sulfuriferula plumbiphila]
MQTGEPSPRRIFEPLCGKIGRDRVDQVIHAFYATLRTDPMLHGFFDGIADFAGHESHIADFWWVALGGTLEQPRQFDMLGRHQGLALTPAAFARWLALFGETLTEYLPIELAAQWLKMAEAIAANLQRHTL